MHIRPVRTQLFGVPDVKQKTDYTCGPSSLLAVAEYFGRTDESEEHIARLAKTNSDIGTTPTNLAQAARALGFAATFKEGMTLADLRANLADGIPVIVLYQAWSEPTPASWKNHWDDGHYSVVTGIDQRHVYLEDPWIKGRINAIPLGEFMDRWHSNDNLAHTPMYQGGITVTQA